MIRAIIVDDEQPSVVKLEKLLNESGMVEVRNTFTEPLVALDYVKNNQVDVAFLDIEMPDMDGIELANRVIDLQGRIAVVFITAYNQYAVEAFRLNALDYLMKPVTVERLRETLERIVREKTIPMNPVKVQIRCFGKFRVTTGYEEVKFRTEKAVELLAFLIDRKGNFVNRNEIIDRLWEEYDGDRALIYFNTTLHYIKKALFQMEVTIPIKHDRGSYRIDTSGFWCDYCRFGEFIAKHGKVNQGNILEYEEVAGLYGGDYLKGEDFYWAEHNRQMLKDQFIRLLLEIAGYYKNDENYPKAAEWLRLGLIHESLHRELNYQLIEALVRGNDLNSANRYYKIYQNEIKRKLRQEPDESFMKLLG